MTKLYLSRASDPATVAEVLASRCTSRKQFERLLAYVVAGDRLAYNRSTWFNLRRELRQVGVVLLEEESYTHGKAA